MTTLFKTPKVRTPAPAPPPPPTELSEADTEAMEAARRRARRGARGRLSTILTGGRGVTGQATLFKKRLLGE